jgi:hypothetical protein
MRQTASDAARPARATVATAAASGTLVSFAWWLLYRSLPVIVLDDSYMEYARAAVQTLLVIALLFSAALSLAIHASGTKLAAAGQLKYLPLLVWTLLWGAVAALMLLLGAWFANHWHFGAEAFLGAIVSTAAVGVLAAPLCGLWLRIFRLTHNISLERTPER